MAEETDKPVTEVDDDLDAAFETKKKKKSKKPKATEEGAPEGTGAGDDAAVEDDMDAMFTSTKKKSSKKKKDKEAAPADEAGEGATAEGGAGEAAVGDDMDSLFSGTKKSKKKKKDKEAAAGAEAGEGVEGEEGAAPGEGEESGELGEDEFSFGPKKGKKKKSKKEEIKEAELTEANYTYEDLLQRVQVLLQEGDPSKSVVFGRVPIKMPPINLVRIGTKKTRWDNFHEICKCMNRTLEHLFQFVVAELGTEGSIDGNNRLVLRGKYVPKGIESLLRKYIGEYVACTTCKSPNTTLTRDSVSRLYFVHCQSCGSSRSVAQIRTGFHAQTRADRRAQRK